MDIRFQVAWCMAARRSKEERAKSKRRPRRQYAALPLTQGRNGERMVMLITSRETGRWVIPKGWPKKGLEPHALAAREAFEEAGLRGEIGHEPIGRYDYAKRLRGGRTVPCEVEVFALSVMGQDDDWPEKGQRATRWFTPAEAAMMVEESGLNALLLKLVETDAAVEQA
jgi:8-oxo-dGTP pyrophosphatase MutT (NUDIX family)